MYAITKIGDKIYRSSTVYIIYAQCLGLFINNFLAELRYYNRWYINKNWFIEANAILATRYRKTNDFKEYYGGLTVPLLVGKGRIEPVEDARQAVYIL
ncbi:MAG: hypothetical protein HN600_10890, partial [Bacteroidetes bacterium]|nr:hypothetical protein [Bacteroidota bacterium]